MPKHLQRDLDDLKKAILTMGAMVEDGAQISVEGIPDGMTARHAGNIDDPDFNNRIDALDRAISSAARKHRQ